MNSYRTHLTVLESSARQYGHFPAFRFPQKVDAEGHVQSWGAITYAQFHADVEREAAYWSEKLRSDGVYPRAIVGMWIPGMDYADVVHIYAMSRAGYIPQLFSIRLPNPTVVYELLGKSGARALVVDNSFRDVVTDCPYPAYISNKGETLYPSSSSPLPRLPPPQAETDLVMLFHTSGSTSGSPKLVPCNYRWLESMIAKSAQVGAPKSVERQDVCTWMGSMCHIGQTFMLLGSLQHGSCTVQPSRIDFTSDELVDMIFRCRLNRLYQWATFLAGHIRRAQQNPKLLSLMQNLDMILYSGLALPREEQEYGYQNGLPIVNLFGSTECGAMMLSSIGQTPDARLLRPLAGTHYEFMPIPGSNKAQQSRHVSANAQLLEMVIMADSPDCPDPSRRSKDGHFHTGDLFVEVLPGQYVSRGRDDDWIKSLNSLRCDTRAIEDNVRATCGELVSECIVVGNGRPSPVLFVEPAGNVEPEQLKRDIIRRTRHFHSRRYMHERITNLNCIVVVDRRALPRTSTKGNIRRQAVEEAYKAQLDQIFGIEL